MLKNSSQYRNIFIPLLFKPFAHVSGEIPLGAVAEIKAGNPKAHHLPRLYLQPVCDLLVGENFGPQIAVSALVQRLPNLRLDPDVDSTPDLMPDITNRGLRSLRLAFEPTTVGQALDPRFTARSYDWRN